MLDLQGRLCIESRVGLDNELMGLTFGAPTFTPVFFDLREQVNDLQVDICVLDNAAQVYGGNENDRHQVTKFVNGAAGDCHRPPVLPDLPRPRRPNTGERILRVRGLGEQLPDALVHR